MLEFFDPAAVVLRVGVGSRQQALGLISELASQRLGLSAHDVLTGLQKREDLGSTGIGRGVAVPHAAVAGLDRVRSIFVSAAQPVAFNAVDDQPVDLFLALLAPPDAVAEHLRALSRVARLMRNGWVREQLRSAASDDAVRAVLRSSTEATAA